MEAEYSRLIAKLVVDGTPPTDKSLAERVLPQQLDEKALGWGDESDGIENGDTKWTTPNVRWSLVKNVSCLRPSFFANCDGVMG